MTAAIAALAFGAGFFVRSPQSSALDAADQQIPVYAAAEMRVVNHGLTAQALVIAGTKTAIDGTLVTAAAKSVVTDRVLDVGQTLAIPAYLGGVSGRPVFALSLSIPLYRDLHFRDSGPDVASFQAALGIEQTGTFTAETREAFVQLYADQNIAPPGENYWHSYVRMSEVVAVPPNSRAPIVTQRADLGTVLSTDKNFVLLQTGAAQVSFRADVQDVLQLAVGGPLVIRGGNGTESPAVVTSIGDFTSGQDGQDGSGATTAGYEILVNFIEEPSPENFGVGQSVTITTSTNEQDPMLSIPVLAVRQDSRGTYVIRRASAGPAESVRIVVVDQGDGWAAIEPGTLSEGDDVKVAP